MKTLFCKKCKCYPDKIKEKYLEPIIEDRKWDGKDYELTYTNFDDVEFVELCGKCKTKLQDIPFDKLPDKFKKSVMVDLL